MESAKTKRAKKGESEFGGSVKGEPTGDESEESDVEEAEVWKVRRCHLRLAACERKLINVTSHTGHASINATDARRHASHGR